MLERMTFANVVCTPLERDLTDCVELLGDAYQFRSSSKKGLCPSNSYGLFIAGRKIEAGRKQENTVG